MVTILSCVPRKLHAMRDSNWGKLVEKWKAGLMRQEG
jgi:hypothetical protein